MEKLLDRSVSSVKKAAAIIILVAAAAYFASFFLGIFTDDAVNLLNASRCGWSYKELAECFRIRVGMSHDGYVPPALAGEVKYYRPLTVLSFKLDTILFGNSFGLYHLQNVVLASANAVFVFLLGLFVLENSGDNPRLTRRAAFLGAILFAACPINFFTVFWISSRTDLLCSFFLLASLLSCFAALGPGAWGGAADAGAGKKAALRLISVVFLVLSLLAKEASVTAPLLVFIFGVLYRLRNSGPGGRTPVIAPSLLDAAPYLAVTAAYFAVRNASIGGLGLPEGVSFYMFPMSDPLFFYFALQKFALGFLSLAFFVPPVPIKMLFYKPLYNVIAACAIVFAAWSAARLSAPLRQRNDFHALAAAFLVCFLPTLPFLPAPHYYYIPSFFFCHIAALRLLSTGHNARRRGYIAAYAGAAVVSAVFLFALMRTTAAHNERFCDLVGSSLDAYERSDHFKKTGEAPEIYVFDAALLTSVSIPEYRLRTRDSRKFYGFMINNATKPFMKDSKVDFRDDGSVAVTSRGGPFFSGFLEEFIYSEKINIAAGARISCDRYEMEVTKTGLNPLTGNTGVTEFVLRFGPGSGGPARRIFLSGNYPHVKRLK